MGGKGWGGPVSALLILGLCASAHALTSGDIQGGNGVFQMLAGEDVTLPSVIHVSSGQTLSITADMTGTGVMPILRGATGSDVLFNVEVGATLVLSGLRFEDAKTVLITREGADVALTGCVFSETVHQAVFLAASESLADVDLMQMLDDTSVDARKNYYGDPTGPHLESRPYGQGAMIAEEASGAIVYAPFYRDADLTNLAKVYFIAPPASENVMNHTAEIMVGTAFEETDAPHQLVYNYYDASGEAICSDPYVELVTTEPGMHSIPAMPCLARPGNYVLKVHAETAVFQVMEGTSIEFAYTLDIREPIITETVFNFENIVTGDYITQLTNTHFEDIVDGVVGETTTKVVYGSTLSFYVDSNEPISTSALMAAVAAEYGNSPDITVTVISSGTAFVSTSSRRMLQTTVRRNFVVAITYTNDNASNADVSAVVDVLQSNTQAAINSILDIPVTVVAESDPEVTTTVTIEIVYDTFAMTEEEAADAYTQTVQAVQQAITDASETFEDSGIILTSETTATVNDGEVETIDLVVPSGSPPVVVPEIPDQTISNVNYEVNVVISGITNINMDVSIPYVDTTSHATCPTTYSIDLFPNDDTTFGTDSPCRNFEAFNFAVQNEIKPDGDLWEAADGNSALSMNMLSGLRTTYRPLIPNGTWSSVATTRLDAQDDTTVRGITYSALDISVPDLMAKCVSSSGESAVTRTDTSAFTEYSFDLYVAATARHGDCSSNYPLLTTTRSFSVKYAYNKATATAQVDVRRDSTLVITELTLAECTLEECQYDNTDGEHECHDMFLRRLEVHAQAHMYSTDDDKSMKVKEVPVGISELDSNPGKRGSASFELQACMPLYDFMSVGTYTNTLIVWGYGGLTPIRWSSLQRARGHLGRVGAY